MRCLLLFGLAAALACGGGGPEMVAETEDIGVLEAPDSVVSRMGAYSGVVDGSVVWLFGETELDAPGDDGRDHRDNGWAWTDEADGISGLTWLEDESGAPAELMPSEDPDVAYRPLDLVEDPDRARSLLFYEKLVSGETVGFGIATWESPDSLPVLPDTEQFTDPLHGFGTGAFTVGDVLIAFACETEGGGWDRPCLVARVPLDEALDASEWVYWSGRGWTPDLDEARPVFHGVSQMGVYLNPSMREYMALYVNEPDQTVMFRSSETPQGPWGGESWLMETEAPAEGQVSYGIVHEALDAEDGTLLTFSYHLPTASGSEIRLVRIALDVGDSGG